MYLVFDPITEFLAGLPEIVCLLQTEPEVRTVAEVTGQAERSVGRDGTATPDDGRDTAVRDTCIYGQTILGQTHLIEELRAKDFAGMREMKFKFLSVCLQNF